MVFVLERRLVDNGGQTLLLSQRTDRADDVKIKNLTPFDRYDLAGQPAD